MTDLRLRAAAKVNLSLRIRPPDANGMHPLLSLAQSIGQHDLLTLSEADDDHLDIAGADIETDRSNLVWKGIDAVRSLTGADRPARVDLTKRIPEAAGLGGGSADAAAAMLGYTEYAGLSTDRLDEAASRVGADVAFCLHGGLRRMEGYGERLSGPLESADDYWMVVAVPPVHLSTPDVYRAWDDLDGPDGYPVEGAAVPPPLRRHGPLVNDLYPAAAALQPTIDDWRADLAERWDRPVLLSGSGPSLFAFFADESEARDGVSVVSQEARAVFAARPVDYGAKFDDR